MVITKIWVVDLEIVVFELNWKDATGLGLQRNWTMLKREFEGSFSFSFSFSFFEGGFKFVLTFI